MFISAKIPIGGLDKYEYGLSKFLIEAKGLAIPSWDPLVGILTKGIPTLYDASFATSVFPPPKPIIT